MTMYVSLFRGINVGGHQAVRMNELKELHESLGLKDVVTYIQSGNVVFSAEETDPAHISHHIEERFVQKFGFPVKVIVRTYDQIQEVIASNPFQDDPPKELKWIVVLFLATQIDGTALEAFKNTYPGPEELHYIGQELYIYYPNGIGRSKLPHTLLEKKLKIVGTGRNWNTVLRLQKMMLAG